MSFYLSLFSWEIKAGYGNLDDSSGKYLIDSLWQAFIDHVFAFVSLFYFTLFKNKAKQIQ
jgi:hypothetical protein